MVTVNITVGEKPQSIDLGTRLENEARIIVFDVSYLIETYGQGTAVLMAKRSQDSTAYPVGVSQDGHEVVWVVTNADVQYKGQGEAELFWYISDTQDGLAKSIVYSTWVADDIGESGEVPQPYEDWVSQVHEYALEAESWAVGERGGESVPETDPTYHNNAKYWSGQSEGYAQEAQATLAQTIYIDDNGLFQIHG